MTPERRRIPPYGAGGMKTDLRRELPQYRARRGRFDLLTVPPMRYLMLDGQGDPNASAAYRDALATLYPVAYALKSFSRDELGRDYAVMPLEALWRADDMDSFTAARDKARWRWTVLMLTPDWLSDGHIADVVVSVGRRKAPPAIHRLRVEELDEGLVIQTLHVGPYDDEGPVLAAMHDEHIPANHLRRTGEHHEVYLGDARRAAPERLRTILRQPVARVRQS